MGYRLRTTVDVVNTHGRVVDAVISAGDAAQVGQQAVKMLLSERCASSFHAALADF